jgi:hypothetical protein
MSIDKVDAFFLDDSSSEFTAQLTVETTIAGNEYRLAVDTSCDWNNGDFTCDEAESDEDTWWTFSGSYSPGTIDAELHAGLGDGSGTIICEGDFSLTGVPD